MLKINSNFNQVLFDTCTANRVQTSDNQDASIFDNKKSADFNVGVDIDIDDIEDLEEFEDAEEFEDISSGTAIDSKYKVNGAIDSFKQGKTNDCWLLGGIQAFSFTENGRQLLKDTISNNGDGTYTLSFKGIGVDVTLSDEDLDKARSKDKYSTGDDDVLLLEVGLQKAFEKVIDENLDVSSSLKDHIKDGDTTIDFGSFRDLTYVLTGNIAELYYSDDYDYSQAMDAIQDDVNNGNIALTCVFEGEQHGKYSKKVNDINGNSVTLTPYASHLFAVKQFDDKSIVIVNPMNSDEEIVLSRKVFDKAVLGITYTNV